MTTYRLRINDFTHAHGENPQLAFQGASPESLAKTFAEALQQPRLFKRWWQQQENPDKIDKTLGDTDANATVLAEQHDLHVELQVRTHLPHRILKQRLNWLIGSNWELYDVR